MRRARAIAALALVACVGACAATESPPPSVGPDAGPAVGRNDAAPPPEDAPPAAVPYPAPHPPMPQVRNLGGKVLAAPKVVVVTYDGDPYRDVLEAFPTALGKSSYWAAVVDEYGVGPISAASSRPVHLSEPAPAVIDDADLKKWLEDKLDGSHPEWDAPDGETIYQIYFPEQTTYTLGGWTGCKEFGASDNALERRDHSLVPYIATPRCADIEGLDAINTLTMVTSHELLEESTDPFKDAWATNRAEDMAWSFTPPFSEIGDMCTTDPGAIIVPDDLGFAVQRAWSNAAAAAGKNPCVPAPATASYYNTLPIMTEDVPMAFSELQWSSTTKGVTVHVGESKTIDLALFSDRETEPWKIEVYDWAVLEGRPPELSLHVDDSTGKNGDARKLTITVLRAGADGGSRFAIFSKLSHDYTFSIGYVAD